jgi:putative addiction module antidote
MEQKIIQIGNSTGVIIPKALLNQIGLETGQEVIIEQDPSTNTLIIAKKGAKAKRSITPEFIDILERVNKQYGSVLKELAQR